MFQKQFVDVDFDNYKNYTGTRSLHGVHLGFAEDFGERDLGGSSKVTLSYDSEDRCPLVNRHSFTKSTSTRCHVKERLPDNFKLCRYNRATLRNNAVHTQVTRTREIFCINLLSDIR
ncbi:uncharacterized protein LOC122528821 [Frieseomelitta varia]|uniref:uncharacterized protein LOC122528821 n=1 Tax=Frieseomelitta varia TaxID=561572 RepID=UPI001CB68EDA|nr:uncharacterized protein LOC122528821 [Frieseomelitta varia]